MPVHKVVVDGLARLPAFSHATVAGDQVFVSGMLGTSLETDELVPGGTGPETIQALQHVERVLTACGCTLADVAKVNVYLTDMSTFGSMNDAYLGFFRSEPPARITVGCTALALDAAVEIDCVAFLPSPRQ